MVALLEKRAGEELFRKHMGGVVASGLVALAAEQGASKPPLPPKPRGEGGGGTGTAAAGGSPQQAAQEGGSAAGGAPSTRLLDTLAFLNELGR